MYAGRNYDPKSMTLERFGFIGMEKKCFWGMVGVEWITPLKVTQLKPGAAAPAKKTVKAKPKKAAPPAKKITEKTVGKVKYKGKKIDNVQVTSPDKQIRLDGVMTKPNVYLM